MKAMLLNKCCESANPLQEGEKDIPCIKSDEILIKVSACRVCHTELDEIEGRLKPPKLPIILGHEIVGVVAKRGEKALKHDLNSRVGIAWINKSCGNCKFCKEGNENLCNEFKATGYDSDGGYAEYTKIHEDYAYPIPNEYSDVEAAPLLCAGVIGYRALRLSGIKQGQVLGLYGFGASAHIAIQVAKYWGVEVYVFTRPGQVKHQQLAKKFKADWVGVTNDVPPKKMDAAIDFTPVGEPVKQALKNLEKGGRVVINAIRKIDSIPKLDYASLIWHEREIKSVANVTRQDAKEFLPLAAKIGIKTEVQIFKFKDVNKALSILKQGIMQGAAVLKIS